MWGLRMGKFTETFVAILHGRNLNIRVCFLVALFSQSAWIVLQGIFLELPILVERLPEEWRLPSYLAMTCQFGNIGAIVYYISKKLFKSRVVGEVPAIYASISFGALLTLMLAMFWAETSTICGVRNSTAFFLITFLVACSSCSTSLTYLPYMARFREEYLTPFYVGFGLSGLLPSIMILVQGVGHVQLKCIWGNATYNNSLTTSPKSESYMVSERTGVARFGASAFFAFLVVMMLCSLLSFIGLNKLKAPKQEMKKAINSSNQCGKNHLPDECKPVLLNSHMAPSEQSDQIQEIELEEEQQDMNAASTKSSKSLVYQDTVVDVGDSSVMGMRTIVWLLVLQGWMSSLMNGIVPSVLSYSCIPYGSDVYHFAVTLSAIADPFACILFHWIVLKRVLYISVLCLLYTALCVYAVVIAALSPCPILMGNASGGIIMILVAVFSNGLASYLMLAVSTAMHKQGEKALFWTGISLQVGAFGGSLLMVLVVNVWNAFQQTNPCKPCIM